MKNIIKFSLKNLINYKNIVEKYLFNGIIHIVEEVQENIKRVLINRRRIYYGYSFCSHYGISNR